MASYTITPLSSFNVDTTLVSVSGYATLDYIPDLSATRWLIVPNSAFNTFPSSGGGSNGPTRPASGLVYPIILS